MFVLNQLPRRHGPEELDGRRVVAAYGRRRRFLHSRMPRRSNWARLARGRPGSPAASESNVTQQVSDRVRAAVGVFKKLKPSSRVRLAAPVVAWTTGNSKNEISVSLP